MPAWGRITPKAAAKSLAAGVSPGAKKAPAALARARPALHNGWVVVKSTPPSRAITAWICRARCAGQPYALLFRSRLRRMSIVVLDDLALAEPKTRLMAQALNRLVGDASALVLIPEKTADVRCDRPLDQ